MFRRDCLYLLERERRTLAAFDRHLARRLHEKRLIGQMLFEYGTLLNAHPCWTGLTVLDIGTGSSTLPRWMAFQGASVVCFEYPRPVEKMVRPGMLARLTNAAGESSRGGLRWVFGNMLDLPFEDNVFDLVSSFTVVEHLDTEVTDRSYVPYQQQKTRVAQLLTEMIRVAKPGGHIYITSECCDYMRATKDLWRPHYYFKGAGPDLSGAWPVCEVQDIFYDYLIEHGCSLVGPISFSPSDLAGDARFETFRGPFFSGFAVLAQKNRTEGVEPD